MTPKEFRAFLEAPESFRFSVEQIKRLLRQYPYTQSLRIALQKRLRLADHPDYEKELHRTATYAYDRVFLKRHINGKPIYIADGTNPENSHDEFDTLELMPLEELQDKVIENSTANTDYQPDLAAQQLEYPTELDDTYETDNNNSNISESEHTLNSTLEYPTELDDTYETDNNDNNISESEHTLNSTLEYPTELDEDYINSEQNSIDMTDNSELQHIILESKKMEVHPPIEEDIDNLLHEDDLEKLDDEIEFGFEIDKKIINDQDDFSLFEKEDEEDSEHHDGENTENKNSEEFDMPLFQQIHEQINTGHKLEQQSEEINHIPEKDPEELPLEEEEIVIPSAENINKIKAVLSNQSVDKAEKKQQIKEALLRISKIPLNEIGAITETYGELLVKQGKIEYAIRLYQQLILKNPQKKVYFAAKIKQLIKKI